MEIRCDKCGHVGPAAEVNASDDGVTLVCENCGRENRLDVDIHASDGDEPALDDASGAMTGRGGRARGDEPVDFADADRARRWLREDALEALVPEPGEGPRCRKCAHLLSPKSDHCPRCGLDAREAEQYAPGQAPWETAPEGKAEAQARAARLWEAFRDEPSDEDLDAFVEFSREEDLLDFAIRKLRFYLVDRPDDEAALERLRDLAGSLQSRLIVAQSRAQASADQFQEDVGRFKRRLIGFTLVFWGVVLLFFIVLFWDSCSGGPPQV